MGSDQDKIAEIQATGVLLDEERWVTHSFGFAFNLDGAIAAYEELWEFPFSILSDQGDEDQWTSPLFDGIRCRSRASQKARAKMEDVAARHGGVYDGWWLTNPRSAGGLMSTPSRTSDSVRLIEPFPNPRPGQFWAASSRKADHLTGLVELQRCVRRSISDERESWQSSSEFSLS